MQHLEQKVSLYSIYAVQTAVNLFVATSCIFIENGANVLKKVLVLDINKLHLLTRGIQEKRTINFQMARQFKNNVLGIIRNKKYS